MLSPFPVRANKKTDTGRIRTGGCSLSHLRTYTRRGEISLSTLRSRAALFCVTGSSLHPAQSTGRDDVHRVP